MVPSAKLAKPQQGFTLIELLVVLVIIGIITAIASLAFYRADSERGMVALTTFNRALVAMREQAILRQHALGVYLVSNGYLVYEITTKADGDIQKTSIPDNTLNMPNAFVGRWQMDIKKGAFVKNNGNGYEQQEKDKPMIAISADGLLTPLTFTFGPHRGQPWWAVNVMPNGEAQITDLRTKA